MTFFFVLYKQNVNDITTHRSTFCGSGIILDQGSIKHMQFAALQS